jgi:hypothetical protein
VRWVHGRRGPLRGPQLLLVEGYYERREEAKQQIREQRQDRRPAGSSDIAPDEAERLEARLRRE